MSTNTENHPYTETTENHPYADLSSPDTNNRTTIDYKTIKHDEHWSADHLYLNKRRYFKHQLNINKGLKNGPCWWNEKYQTHCSNLDLIDIIAESLGLTVKQRERARRLFVSFDLQDFGIAKELVGCSLALYLVHTDDRDERKCHPNNKEEDKAEIYDKALIRYRLLEKNIRKTYGKVEYRIRRGEGI